jgi:HEAT repeat protein
MTFSAEEQVARLASDNEFIYKDAWRWFLAQGPAASQVLIQGLADSSLGSVCHWRILLVLRELALPSSLPAILRSFRLALAQNDAIVLPGAMEALAAFHTEEVIDALASVVKGGEIDDVKHAVALLGKMGGSYAVKSLAAFLDHRQAEVRKGVVRALLSANTASAREALDRHRSRENDPAVLAVMDQTA